MDRNDEIETRGRVETEHFYLKKKKKPVFFCGNFGLIQRNTWHEPGRTIFPS